MRILRLWLSVAVALALTGGYLGSVYHYFSGTAPAWARMVDTPLVVALALLVLIAAIVLSFVPDQEERT
jgi:nitric oxide reductase large subunit